MFGAALFAWHQILDNERKADDVNDSQHGSYLGPAYGNDEIRTYLETQRIPFVELSDAELPEKIGGAVCTASKRDLRLGCDGARPPRNKDERRRN